jgi:hypothetical protein
VKRSTRVEKLAKVAKDNAWALAGLAAKGSEEAAVELYRTAASTTQLLTDLCNLKPQAFTGIAETKFSWPLMYNPHPESVEEDAKFIKKIKLAAKTNINLSSGKPFSWRTPANVVVFELYQLAQDLQRAPISEWRGDFGSIAACGVGLVPSGAHIYDARYEKQLKELEAWGQHGVGKCLPPLSKQTARHWATATKELFKIAYPGDFEQHPKLQRLKKSVLGHARTAAYGKPPRAGDIRAAMLRKVKQAWASIAALD